MPSGCLDVPTLKKALATIAAEIEREYGPRCPGSDWGCPICIAWERYDKVAEILTGADVSDNCTTLIAQDLMDERQARDADRREWVEHMRTLGPMLQQAKKEGMLDALIEGNLWPLPKCAITDADVQKSIEIARRIRPAIEAEQKSNK